MKKRVFRILAVAFLWFCAALAASALEDIPVYGPARVAVEDSDLLAGTVLEVGVLAVTPDQPYRVVIGDGITPGGIPIHPEGCVTQFNQIANATTNLNMHSYSITFGPWAMSGGMDEFGLTWGGSETWLRLVRDTGIAYLSYDFTIIDPAHYRFELVWTGEGYDFPVLMVSTNLLQGYAAVDPDDVTYLRPDVSHLVVEYSVPGDYEFLGFRFFAPSRLKTGAYFSVPVVADYGLQAVGSLCVTGRVESYYDEHAEENRDRYVPGSITIDGEEVATTGAVAAVAADLAAHQAATNPHEITPDLLGMRLWLALRGLAISSDISEGFSHLFGFDEYLSFEEYMWEHNVPNVDFTLISTNSSTWNFSTVSRPKWNNVGLATTGDVATAVSAHAVRTDNPHAVTFAQAYAAAEPTGIVWDDAYGVAQLRGFGREVSLEDATFYGEWSFDERPNVGTNGLATTNEVASAVSFLSDTVADWVGDVADDLARATNALSADIATNAAAIGALDGRVGALEDTAWPMDTTFVYWPPEALSSTQTNWIPTNWPSRNIELYIHDTGVVPCIVALTNWTPAQDCRITIHINSTTTPATNRNFRLQIGTTTPSGATTANTGTRRTFQLSWIASIARWQYNTYTPPGGESMYESSGRGGIYETARAYSTFPDSAFLPVHSTSEEE